MKTVYRLKYNLPTFWKGDICVLDERGDLWWVGSENLELRELEKERHFQDRVRMYNWQTLKAFKILETYFEEVEHYIVLDWPEDDMRNGKKKKDQTAKANSRIYREEWDPNNTAGYQSKWIYGTYKEVKGLGRTGFLIKSYEVRDDGTCTIEATFNPRAKECVIDHMSNMMGVLWGFQPNGN